MIAAAVAVAIAEALAAHDVAHLADDEQQAEAIAAALAAIALTPGPGFAGDAKAHGLEEKNGRLLLREETAEEERTSRVLALLDAMTE